MTAPAPAPRARRLRPIAGLSMLALAALVLIVPPRAASAHLYLKSSQPENNATLDEAPGRVVLEFSEPVDLESARVNVLDAEEQRVDRGQVRQVGGDRYTIQIALASPLENGRYTVVWRLIAQDGHPRTGRVRFRLSAPTPPSPIPEEEMEEEMGEEGAGDAADEGGHGGVEEPDIAAGGSDAIAGSHLGTLAAVLQGVGKFFVFLSLLSLTGLVAYALLVWRRPSGIPPEDAARVEERSASRWRLLVAIAWAVALVASLATVVLQAAIEVDVPLRELRPGLVGDVLDTRFGQTALWRVGLLLTGAVLWVLAPRLVSIAPARRPRVALTHGADEGAAQATVLGWGSAPFVLALLATVSLAGHAGATPLSVLNLSSDVLHLLGVGAWLGGLLALLLVGFPSTRALGEVERCRTLAPAIARFSNLAVVAIVVIVATGVIRSLVELDGLDGLTTSYGWTLLTKVGVFLPALALGAFNNRRTKPACLAAAAAGESTPAMGTLRRLITIEVVLGIVVVGLAAFLVNLSPPRTMEGMHALLSF